MIYTILLVVAVILSILIIFFILMQQGKGDASGMFGGGSSGAVFGASGAGNFITKLTTFLVFLFFLNCLGLAYLAKSNVTQESLIINSETSKVGDDANTSTKSIDDKKNISDIEIPD